MATRRATFTGNCWAWGQQWFRLIHGGQHAHTLNVDGDWLALRRGRRLLSAVDRDEIEAVSFEQIGYPFRDDSELRVRFVDGSYAPAVLVPYRPREVEQWLRAAGWPVETVMGPPLRRQVRALPAGGDGRTEPGSVYGRGGTRPVVALLLTVLVAVATAGFLGIWIHGYRGVVASPDWGRYVGAVLDGDEATVMSMLCGDIRQELDDGPGGFTAARAATIASFRSPPVHYDGLVRGGHRFVLQDDSRVFHAIPSVDEGADRRSPCPASTSALLGMPTE